MKVSVEKKNDKVYIIFERENDIEGVKLSVTDAFSLKSKLDVALLDAIADDISNSSN